MQPEDGNCDESKAKVCRSCKPVSVAAVARTGTCITRRQMDARLCVLILSLALAAASEGSAVLSTASDQLSRVQDSYFVHVRAGVSAQDLASGLFAELRELHKNLSLPEFKARVQGVVSEVAHGFAAKLSPEALEMVLSHDDVALVEEDQYVHLGETTMGTVGTWGLDRIMHNNPLTAPCNLTGEGVDVYVLDTGIRYDHKEFDDSRAQYALCDVADELYGEHQVGNDCTGHGTHVAGTVGGLKYGVAPGVTVFSVRVINCYNIGSWNTIVQGLECVLVNAKRRGRPSIVNMSLYGEKNRAVKQAVEELVKKGITVVTISGNNRPNPKNACRICPAAITGVITVGGSTSEDKAYELSNAGICVDIIAPAKEVVSASYICTYCRETKSGTSMAAPHVTGAIALLLQKCPNFPPWKVKHYLLSEMTAIDALDMTPIPHRLRDETPNLLLSLDERLCSIQC